MTVDVAAGEAGEERDAEADRPGADHERAVARPQAERAAAWAPIDRNSTLAASSKVRFPAG